MASKAAWAVILAAPLAAFTTAKASACVHGERTANGIVYHEVGPRCPNDDPWSRPTMEQRQAAERQQAAEAEARRAAQQGRAVRRLSDDQCSALIRPLSHGVAAMGPTWVAGQPSRDNHYMTPQENWCMAQARSHSAPADNVFPGLLPDGYHADYLGIGHWRISR